ncbi:MAG: VWA domain-containing protein [bacterium]
MNRIAPALIVASLALSGCQALYDLRTLQEAHPGDIQDVLADDLAQALQIGVAGLSPSPNYRSNGAVDLSLISRGSKVSAKDVLVQVKNHDGSYSDCDHGEGVVYGAAPLNVMTLLIDGSGSMERSYNDGTCDTCPHDPGRERVGAAHRFIDTLYDIDPTNRLAVAEFGPDPTYGFGATALHADFSDDRRMLWTALDSIGGDQPLGTPLYDSVVEMIEATASEADYVSHEHREAAQRHVIILSDGLDNDSDYYDLQDAIGAAIDHDVRVYVVGLGPASAADTRFDDADNAIRSLQILAEETGGFYAGVDDPSRLHQMFDNVAYALAGGYERHTYACVPANVRTTQPGKRHHPGRVLKGESSKSRPVMSRPSGRSSRRDRRIAHF